MLPGGIEGYGAFYYQGRSMGAHRASYLMHVAPIPPGFVVDHLCRQRNCVRPAHLEAVTGGENTRRAQSWMAGASWQRSKTHCPYGHPYSGDNLRICKDGKRACRTCERRYTAEWRARRLAANPPSPKAPKAHCTNGHAFAEWGYLDSAGKRACRLCARDRCRAHRARRRALQGSASEKVTCKNGHPWTPENIYLDSRGYKQCRACHNERSAERRRILKTKRDAAPKAIREVCANGHPWCCDNVYVTPQGDEKCRECARDRHRKYEAKLKAARPPAQPKPPRTQCSHGHELAGENLYVAPSGRKFCRMCMVIYQARHRAARAAAA
jgi:hypothetical protein